MRSFAYGAVNRALLRTTETFAAATSSIAKTTFEKVSGSQDEKGSGALPAMSFAASLLGRVDGAKISPSVAEAGDETSPPTAQHQGGWIMRMLEGVTEVAFGCAGAHGTWIVRMLARPTIETEAAHRADAGCSTDARLASASALASVASH